MKNDNRYPAPSQGRTSSWVDNYSAEAQRALAMVPTGRQRSDSDRQFVRRPTRSGQVADMPSTRGNNLPRPIIRTWQCPVTSCDWYRQWNDDFRGNLVIHHPQWGEVTARNAAALDISAHSCESAKVASRKARELFGPCKYTLYVPKGIVDAVA